MAKETMIVFVYDTECLKDEADDPVKAVLYFHPSWVSDNQKVALCGQLMGTAYFLDSCFFKPRIIALQNGKFVLKQFGRFLLAVGSDRNISDYLLEQRGDTLASLVKLFHRDLQTIHDQFALQSQYKNLSEKLYHIFETYLPILQFNSNIFQNVPKLRIPKTANNIFLEALQTLQSCQQTKGILGGAILYHNKIVSSQLSDTLTKQLVLTDPLHIRTPAELINNTDFHIPNGVQMIVVYIDVPEYRKLLADAQHAQGLQTTQLSQGALNFQFSSKRKMKRDKSLIFTNIPEEGSAAPGEHENGGDEGAILNENQKLQSQSVRPKPLLMRPTHLPLRLKNFNSKELPESGIASINFDETDSYPEFIGRTSVCSTPMTENKVLQVGSIMSICANPEDESNSNNKQQSITTPHSNRRNSLKQDFEKFFQNFMSHSSSRPMERRNSLTDLQDSLKKLSKKFSMKQFSTTSLNQKTDVNRNKSGELLAETPDFIDGDEEDNCSENASIGGGSVSGSCSGSGSGSGSMNKSTLTITDPTNPIFKANGQPISRGLFQEIMDKYQKLCEASRSTDSKEDAEIARLVEEFREFDNELKQLDESLRQDAVNSVTANFKPDSNLNISAAACSAEVATSNIMQSNASTTNAPIDIKPKTPLDKKSLSLPIKPLTEPMTPLNEHVPFPAAATATAAAAAAPPLNYNSSSSSNRKQGVAGGVPLTPLMAKLSVLAMSEEQQRGYGDGTPAGTGIEIHTPLTTAKMFSRRNSLKCDDAVDALITVGDNGGNHSLQRTELYICGQQNMTLLLLMEEGSARQQQIVQKMFDMCVAKFPHMESYLNQTLNVNVEGDKREGKYSFVAMNAKWDTLERKGPWNPMELNTLESMHHDLCEDFGGEDNAITDLILRSHDTVFYGIKSGSSEFLYKEPAQQMTTGIPPPSDAMNNVQQRAKQHLERDNSYIVL